MILPFYPIHIPVLVIIYSHYMVSYYFLPLLYSFDLLLHSAHLSLSMIIHPLLLLFHLLLFSGHLRWFHPIFHSFHVVPYWHHFHTLLYSLPLFPSTHHTALYTSFTILRNVSDCVFSIASFVFLRLVSIFLTKLTFHFVWMELW